MGGGVCVSACNASVRHRAGGVRVRGQPFGVASLLPPHEAWIGLPSSGWGRPLYLWARLSVLLLL